MYIRIIAMPMFEHMFNEVCIELKCVSNIRF